VTTEGREMTESSTAAEDWRTFRPTELSPILEVALREIGAHGYDATSVRTIAREVGVTVPALYYHFENKQAMLSTLLDRAMTIITEHIDGALAAAGDDPVERLSGIVEAIVLYSAHHRDLAFLDSERRSLTEENRRRYVAHRDRVEQLLRETIGAGCEQGSFDTAEVEECGRAILSMCQAVAGWYNPRGPRTPEATARQYVGIALAVVGHRTPETR
jgi:AcrR family transcriptional regulator